jgi:hypothetical protein
VSLPFFIILVVYAYRASNPVFIHMASWSPAPFLISMTILLALVIVGSVVIRFNLTRGSVRGIGLVVMAASLILQDLSIAFYAHYSSRLERAQLVAKMASYANRHMNKYTAWWAGYLVKHLDNPIGAEWAFVNDRTLNPARLGLGFGLPWFVIHMRALYLLIFPKDSPLTHPIFASGGSSGHK